MTEMLYVDCPFEHRAICTYMVSWRVNSFRSCSPGKWACTLMRGSWNKKVGKEILSLLLRTSEKSENYKNANLTRVLLIYGTSLRKLVEPSECCFWCSTATIVSIFQRAKLLQHIALFLFILLNISQKPRKTAVCL